MADCGRSSPGRGRNMGVVLVLVGVGGVLVVDGKRHHVRRVVLYSVSRGCCRYQAAEGRA